MQLEKYTLEFPIKTTPKLLNQFLLHPTGLQQWFADDVQQDEDILTFNWSGEKEQAKIIVAKARNRIKWQWLNEIQPENYCELSYSICAMTNQTIVTITDTAKSENVADAIQLWQHAIQQLKMKLRA